jgi:predicted MFS family arabinose efflux permease
VGDWGVGVAQVEAEGGLVAGAGGDEMDLLRVPPGAGREEFGDRCVALVLLALAVLNAAFPPERRGWALGIFGGVTGLGVLVGPVLGGAITQGIAWRWIFWINVPVAMLAIPLVLAKITESRSPRAGFDLPGLAMGTGGALGLVWALVRGNTAGWGSPEVVAALLAGAGLVAAFIGWERRARAPMLPMRLFGSRPFSAGNAVVFFLNASLTGAIFFMAQFQQTTLGQGPLDAGLRLLPWGIIPFLLAPRTGALADRIGERPLIVAGLFCQTAGMAGIAVIARPGLAYVTMIAPMVISGLGVTLAIPAVTKSVVGSVARGDIGTASGAFSTVRQLGGAFGVAALVAVFSGAGSYASARAFSNGFAPAMGVAAGLALAGALAGLMLPGRPTAGSAPATSAPATSTPAGNAPVRELDRL